MDRVAFARGGFSVELPEGWDGPQEIDEAGWPAVATYRLRNRTAGPLEGAEVLVVRRTGLNPMMRERWLQGRAPLPLDGVRPVEALRGAGMPFASGAGFRMEGEGQTALVYYTAHGPAYYFVGVSAPTDADEGALLALAWSIRFDGAE